MKRLLFLSVALTAACEVPAPSTSGQLGEAVPAYGALTMAGDSLYLADLKGEVVLLNVWATWCIPCRREVPELQALHTELEPRGLRVLGVSVDASGSDAAIRSFAEEFGMTYTILRDPGEVVSSTFRIQGVPASFLIDRSGTVVWRHLGPFEQNDSTLRNALGSALDG